MRVKLDISLLIQFPGKSTPEKQQLIISLKTNENNNSFFENLFAKNLPVGQFDIEIRHTERTWADDILNLLSKEFELVQAPENKIKKALRKAFLPFAGVLFPGILFIGMILNVARNFGENGKIISKAADLLNAKPVSPELLNEKLNTLLIIARSQSENQGSGFIYAFLTSLGIGAFVIFLGATLAQPSPSFILISKASEKNKSEVEKKLNRRLIGAVGSMAATIIIGLAVNYIYDKIK